MRVAATLWLSAIGLVLGSLLTPAPLGAQPANDAGANASEPYTLSVVTDGLDHPWGIAFLPNGDMLVTEKPGRLRRIANDILDPEPIAGVPEVRYAGQGGLLDVVLHPDFETNARVYLTYSHAVENGTTLSLAHARLTAIGLADVTVIFTSDPALETDVHMGGRVVFLNDGTLLLTGGDGFNYREDAQRLENHLGTIVRLNDDGTVPEDNPFTSLANAKPEIWSYGHRNAQAIVYDTARDRVFAHEHGPQGGDELNLIQRGTNYGWPIASFGIDYTGARITPFEEYEGMEPPLVYWTPSIAPAGMALYTGDAFPTWTGDVFVAALIPGDAAEDGVTSGHVRRIPMSNGMPVSEGPDETSEVLFSELEERVRDVRSGPDGALYLATEGPKGATQPAGRIWRVTPRTPDNQ